MYTEFKMAEAAFRPPVFRATETNACQVWREFKEDMDNYIIAAGLEKADGQRKVGILLYSMGTR